MTTDIYLQRWRVLCIQRRHDAAKARKDTRGQHEAQGELSRAKHELLRMEMRA